MKRPRSKSIHSEADNADSRVKQSDLLAELEKFNTLNFPEAPTG